MTALTRAQAGTSAQGVLLLLLIAAYLVAAVSAR